MRFGLVNRGDWLRLLFVLSAHTWATMGFAAEVDPVVPPVNKEGRDVQTLSAKVGARLLFAKSGVLAVDELRIHPSDCVLQDEETFDCTEAVRRDLNLYAGYEAVVLLRPVLFKSVQTTDGPAFPAAMTCSLIELRTVVRKSISDSKRFEGLGFFAADKLVYINKEQLLDQKDAFFLNNNEPAIVHTFLDVSLCQPEGKPVYEFKAFAQFVAEKNLQTFRVWEALPQNYRLSLDQGRKGFDRTLDVLRPLD